MGYDKTIDYQAEINKALGNNDYYKAAQLEQSRNEKILGEKLDYATTSNYLGNLDTTDYSQKMMQQIASGADPNEVAASLAARNNKINTALNLKGYANDDYTRAAEMYLNNAPAKNTIKSATSLDPNITEIFNLQILQAINDLDAEYEKNKLDLEATAAKIPATYQLMRNQTAAASEQNRAAFNEQALANGINSGAGSQASLAMYNRLLGDMSTINSQEAQATSDIDTQRLKLSIEYNHAIEEAKAEGNIAKAQALYNEAVRVDESLVAQSQAQAAQNFQYWSAKNSFNQQNYEKQMIKAQQMAAFGNFTGYLALGYTQDEVNLMKKAWIAQNPLLAKSLGIS